MFDPSKERWPPAYDSEELASSINSLVNSTTFETDFYQQDGSYGELSFYQGDVIQLCSQLPLIHEDGEPGLWNEIEYWLIIGNSCDMAREIQVVEHTQVVPILDLGLISEASQQLLDALRRYSYSRRFYVPPWNSSVDKVYFADFTKPVTMHKGALGEHAELVISLSIKSWILLNACLVRFFGRDDGRND